MREFPVAVKLCDFTIPQNAEYGSRICVNKENDMTHHIQKAKEYVLARIKDGHESVIEHIILTVEVSNISRALLQQFARHRLLSLSVQSTRWALKSIVDKEEIGFILPEALQSDPKVTAWLNDGFELIQEMRKKHGNDIAKYLIPECTPTKMLVTGNIREWRHIYKLRKDPPAMKEFNDFCNALLEAVHTTLPPLAEILAYE